MTRLTPIFGSRKTLNVTYATPRETLLGTPETLPTSEPANPQIAYTVQESDLPTFDIKPYSTIYLGRLLAGGQCVTAATISWRMTKNGANVATSVLSVSANYYYVVDACFLDVKVGDVLGLKLWSNQSDSNWDRSAIAIHPSRIYPLPTPLYKDVTISCVYSQSFTNFNAAVTGSDGNAFVYNGHINIRASSYTAPWSLSGISLLACVSPYGMIRTGMGDSAVSNTARTGTGATRPSVVRFPVPSQLTFRGAYLDRHQ